MDERCLRLFGSPVCAVGGTAIPLLAERGPQLAAFLATSGEWQPRERIAAMFWPDLGAASARRNLRHLLFKAGPHWPGLEARAGAIRLAMRVDAREFEAAHEAGDYARAVELYRGPFADGLEANAPAPFDEWLRFERNRYAAMFRTAAARRLTQLPDAADRERLARHWSGLEPLDEDALLALVEAVVASGQGAEARRLAQDFGQRLTEQLGIEPSVRVRTLGAASEAAGPSAPSPSPSRADRVAAADPGFVGRRAELLELQSLLERDECRVLTVAGPGGIGKSRLARVARSLASVRHEETAWLALEDLTEDAQIVPRLAAALELPLAGAGDPLSQVIERLGSRRVLLVADNSEHLTGFADLCARLIAACPSLQVLNTSRTRLAIAGEWLLPLAGLPVPDADEGDAELLRNFDAVRLFEARARAVLPGFDGRASAAEVAALARELEGTPLAIELAAAWVRVLPVADIRREIARSLALLEGPADAGRQRSVLASFEHSWALLASVEQQVLARLAVFAGPFTREAAAQVADAGLPVLAALVDKSLLRAEGNGRLSLHALTRQCARDRLAETETVRQRHMRHFARALAKHDGPPLSLKSVLDEIEAELEDLRLAWQHAVVLRHAPSLERMAVPLMRFFEIKGRLAEGTALMQDAIQALEDDAADALEPQATRRLALAALHRGLGTLRYRQGDLEAAPRALARAAALYRELQLPGALRPCELLLGVSAWARGEMDAAERHFAEVLRLAEPDAAADDAAARAANGLALCARSRGDHDRAVDLHRQAIRLHRAAGNAAGEAAALHDLGVAQIYRRQPAEAERALALALSVCDRHGLDHTRVYCLVSLGFAHIDQGQFDAAQRTLDAAALADRSSGPSLVSPMVRLASARVATRCGRPELAARLLGEALAAFRSLASVPMLLAAMVFVGEWLAATGQRVRAAGLWSAVDADPRAEHNDREDARNFLAQLRPDATEGDAAGRYARSFDLERAVDSLLTKLSPASAPPAEP